MTIEQYVWAAMILSTAVCGLYVIGGSVYERRELRRMVRLNLNNALEGGQFDPGGYLHGLGVLDIAQDMTLYAEDLAGYSEEDLVPHVQDWVDERAQKLLSYSRVRDWGTAP